VATTATSAAPSDAATAAPLSPASPTSEPPALDGAAAAQPQTDSQAGGQLASATPAVQPKPATVVAVPATGSKQVKSKPSPADATTHPKPAVAASAAQASATSAPTLDLAALKQRLRDTRAIGVFTKLALKNQVDDLLDKFRGFYGGQLKTTLPELRQLYELLVQKVLALLQDSDPPLAKEIVASREAIWSLLADPQKFATL
jgi:hypothetical protein